MKRLIPLTLLLLGVLCSSCIPSTFTLPKLSKPDAPVVLESLIIPENMEIISTDYIATMAADSSTWKGRAFVKIYAVHKETKEKYLLLYEELDKRSRPFKIIKFEKEKFEGI